MYDVLTIGIISSIDIILFYVFIFGKTPKSQEVLSNPKGLRLILLEEFVKLINKVLDLIMTQSR